jgi:tetratricopeptide (TPR) repeat protein
MPLLRRTLVVLLLVAGPLLADVNADVRAHFKKGQTHYALGEFQAAIEEFREAYRLKQEPAILFNLAQSYRQIHEWQHAYFHYRQYLNQRPDAPNRPEVEGLIEQMKGKMDEEERLAKAEGATPATPPPTVTVKPATPPPPPKPAFVATTPAPKIEQSHALRYTGYVALGLGAVAEGAAFAFHSSAQSSADQFNGKYQAGTLTPADSKLRDDAQSKGKLATTAVVAGAALLVAGAVLTFAF